MKQAATALATHHAFNIQEPTVLTVHATERSNRISDSHKTDVNGNGFYNEASQLQYGDKIKLSYVINESYKAHFVLIKGLIEFHRSPGNSFSFDRQAGTFDITLSSASSTLEDLTKFLRKIAVWLDQELSFKKQLKEMIAFEREYRAKVAKVYAGGEGYTIAPGLN